MNLSDSSPATAGGSFSRLGLGSSSGRGPRIFFHSGDFLAKQRPTRSTLGITRMRMMARVIDPLGRPSLRLPDCDGGMLGFLDRVGSPEGETASSGQGREYVLADSESTAGTTICRDGGGY